MYPVLFKIGPLEIGSFGVMMAMGFIVAAIVMRYELKRRNLDPDWANNYVFAAAIGGIVGARLYYIFENLDILFQDPLGIIFSRGGLTWYGGFIGGILAVLWAIKKTPAPKLIVADVIAPLLLLGYGIGRIGCFLAGDGDYGPPSDLPWAMAFPNGVVPTDLPVHPTPVYETLMSFTLFAILWFNRKRIKTPGLMVSGMLIFYGIERFVAEFWRLTPKILFGWMSMAQILSIVSILAGIGWAIYLLKFRQPAMVSTTPETKKRQKKK